MGADESAQHVIETRSDRLLAARDVARRTPCTTPLGSTAAGDPRSCR
ncbi:hypothetical protein MO973_31790 [Paenibacillus sp. TRM 82003]|nr:hypothetical protein [Paenibacillus sp. TRM 82003]